MLESTMKIKTITLGRGISMVEQLRNLLEVPKADVANGNHAQNNGKSHDPIGPMPAYTDPFLEQARSRKIPSLYILLKLYKGARKTHESLCEANGQTCPSDIKTLQLKYEAYLGVLKEKIKGFEKKYGPITDLYLCSDRKTAAVLTKKSKFLTVYHLGNDPDLESLLIRIEFLAAETSRLLRGRDLEECMHLIYSVTKRTLSLLDMLDQAKEADQLDHKQLLEKKKKTIASIKKLIQNAKAYHQRAAKLKAQLTYGIGTLMGIALLSVIVMFSWVWHLVPSSAITEMTNLPTDIWLAILISGGVGAIVSVMSRISAGHLVLDYEVGEPTLGLIGVIRPFLGVVFAILIVILLKSELASNIVPTIADADNLTLLVVGFLAGFSERLAPDLLDRAQGNLSNGE
jgi:hypothetical protein